MTVCARLPPCLPTCTSAAPLACKAPLPMLRCAVPRRVLCALPRRYTELSRQVRGGVAEDAQVMGEEYGMVLAQVAQHRGWIPSTAPF